MAAPVCGGAGAGVFSADCGGVYAGRVCGGWRWWFLLRDDGAEKRAAVAGWE
ncbi:hypothetical protein [Treponema primitia]|uniref:hypothetical protein n=1 Tax=Treponema primitia TaxID=88058 RepID=UPI00030904FF|nr:hypothetical protein [Treponema primitia]